jgi:membrane protease YdiL (CAAX protease family)
VCTRFSNLKNNSTKRVISMKEGSTISPLAAILAVVASWFLVQFLGYAAFVFVGYPIAQICVELLVLVIPLGYMLYKRVDIRSFIGFDTKPQNIILGIVLGVSILAFDIFVTTWLVLIFGPSNAVEKSNSLIINAGSTPVGIALIIVALLLAGICEEFTFRGFLQTAVNSRYSFGTALVVSSIAFGFFHFDPQAVYSISAFFVGLIFGYIYHHWHSYLVPVAAHATVDLITMTLLLLGI